MADTFVRHLVVGLAALDVSLGAALIAGGSARASGPSFQTINTLGGPEVWGFAFVVAGVLTFAAWFERHVTVLNACLLGTGALYWFFALSFAYAAWVTAQAAFTGVVVYTAAGLFHAGLIPLNPVRRRGAG